MHCALSLSLRKTRFSHFLSFFFLSLILNRSLSFQLSFLVSNSESFFVISTLISWMIFLFWIHLYHFNVDFLSELHHSSNLFFISRFSSFTSHTTHFRSLWFSCTFLLSIKLSHSFYSRLLNCSSITQVISTFNCFYLVLFWIFSCICFIYMQEIKVYCVNNYHVLSFDLLNCIAFFMLY